MENKKYKFWELLLLPVSFVIKAYQRIFEPSEAWLESIMNDFSTNLSNGRKVFLLSGLFKEYFEGKIKKVSIVDAQQRFTTWLIGCVALVVRWSKTAEGKNNAAYKNFKAEILEFTKNHFEYTLKKRDTNLYNILVSKLSNENYNIENKNVKRVFDKWMKTFDKNGLDNIEYMKALKNATMCVNLLEPEDDEEEYFIKANKKKTPMGVYSLVSPAFFKFSNEDKEQLADKYDEFTNENFVPASSGAGMQIYWLDHIIRTACMIDLKMYLPIVKESTAQEIAEKIYNNCEKQKKNLYKICEEYKDYFQYLNNPENLDAGNPESVKTIQNGIRACRALIPGKMTTVDATIVKMLWLRRNDSENVTLDKIAKFMNALHVYLVRKYFAKSGLSDASSEKFEKFMICNDGVEKILREEDVYSAFFKAMDENGLTYATDTEIEKLVKDWAEDGAKAYRSKLSKICKSMQLMYPENENFADTSTFPDSIFGEVGVSENLIFLNNALLSKLNQ